YFINTGNQQQCGGPSQNLRTASLLGVRQRGVGLGRRHVGPPGLSQCRVSAIQRHAGKEGSQPEKDMDEMQYIISGVASV
uniref:Polyprotein n=1 Tax=Mesocestoides corti TaxID=53468 RepID=A0A5K3ET81_MESCO